MNWEAIGAVSEIVGAFAVVVSLLYLAVQIKQGTALSKADFFERASESWNTANEPLLDPANADLFHRGRQRYSQLDEIERSRFGILLGRLILSFESGMEKHRLGFVSDDFVQTYEHYFRELFDSPGVREYWESEKNGYTPMMGEWVKKFYDSTE
jgi:hypothetical protein